MNKAKNLLKEEYLQVQKRWEMVFTTVNSVLYIFVSLMVKK